jgi:hypothetical protein
MVNLGEGGKTGASARKSPFGWRIRARPAYLAIFDNMVVESAA